MAIDDFGVGGQGHVFALADGFDDAVADDHVAVGEDLVLGVDGEDDGVADHGVGHGSVLVFLWLEGARTRRPAGFLL
ncbi:hypothetical protein D3C81_2021020 [compost metagenome]